MSYVTSHRGEVPGLGGDDRAGIGRAARAPTGSTPVAPPAAGGRRGPGRYLLAGAAAAALVLAGGGAGAAIAVHYEGTTTVAASAPPSGQGSAAATSQQLARAAAAALPSVVTIMVTTSSGSGEGSGVVLRSDGTILTNNHVVEAAAGGAGVIKVTFADGQIKDAVLLGQDAAADIAVVRASGVTGAIPARLGSPSGLQVGDTVLAVGSPLGLTGTVTSGIVSALHRSITAANRGSPDNGLLPGQSQQGTSEVLRDVIQTDTAINPGNSGGALVDDTGRVVGITTAIASVGGGYIGQQSGSIGVGFAIPISIAYQVASKILGTG